MFRKTRHRASTLSSSGTSLQEKDFIVHVEPPKTIECSLCQAVYTPSTQQQEGPSAASPALETAFLHVCHFCFRCQRQACPQCWNPVHHVCTSCGEEAQLPFCSPVPSLEGLILFPTDDSPSLLSQSPVQPFICLHNGRFYTPTSSNPVSRPHTQKGTSAETANHSRAGDNAASLSAQDGSTPSQEIYPSWIQEIMGYKPGDQPAAHSASFSRNQIINSPGYQNAGQVIPQNEFKLNEHQPAAHSASFSRNQIINRSGYQNAGQVIPQNEFKLNEHQPASHSASFSHINRSRPENPSQIYPPENSAEAPLTRRLQWTPDTLTSAPHTRRLEWEPEPPFQPPQPEFLAYPGEVYGTATALPDNHPQTNGDSRVIERIENILIVITSTILMVLILLIVFAMSSVNMNDLFLHLLHVDIRGEISYLLQLV